MKFKTSEKISEVETSLRVVYFTFESPQTFVMKHDFLKSDQSTISLFVTSVFFIAIFLIAILVKDVIDPYFVMAVMVLSLVIPEIILTKNLIGFFKSRNKKFSLKIVLLLVMIILFAVTLFLILQNILIMLL